MRMLCGFRSCFCLKSLHSLSGFLVAVELGVLCSFLLFHFLRIGHVLLVDWVNHGYGIGFLGLLVHLSLLEFGWRYKSSDCPLLYITNSCMIFHLNMKCLFFSCHDASVLSVLNPNFSARPSCISFYLFFFKFSILSSHLYILFSYNNFFCQELLTILYSESPEAEYLHAINLWWRHFWTFAGQTLRIACGSIIICKIILFCILWHAGSKWYPEGKKKYGIGFRMFLSLFAGKLSSKFAYISFNSFQVFFFFIINICHILVST